MTLMGLEEPITGEGAVFTPCPLKNFDDSAREEYWATLALRHTGGIGRRTLVKLLKAFGSAYAACKNPGLWGDYGIDPRKASTLMQEKWRTDAKKEWDEASRSDCRIVLWRSHAYPRYLRELPDAPGLLYTRGNLELLAGPCIGLVGTREPTAEGRTIARTFGRLLSASGITIVSGMALGIDRFSHMGALSGPGSSIGVLGTGIDWIYPRSNADLFGVMAKVGLLISEFSPHAQPLAANFPIRNRIISGLSLGVVVVEAAARSGSLLTARLALEQNREVFAVPGHALSATSQGCQNLVRQGARPVFNAEDILRDLAPVLRTFERTFCSRAGAQISAADRTFTISLPQEDIEPESEVPPDPAQAKAADCLLGGDASGLIINLLRQKGILHIEQLVSESGLPFSEMNAALLGLEMTGQIIRHPGARFEAC